MIKIKDLIGLPSLQYHLDNGLTLSENVYRYSSERFIQLFAEARDAWRDGLIELNEEDAQLLESTDIGEYGIFEGEKVPLDLPMVDEQMDIYDDIANEEFGMDFDQLGPNEQEWVRNEIDNLSEAEYQGREDDRKYALLKVRPENYNLMIDKLQDMNINHTRHSGTEGVIKVYTDRIPDKVLYRLTHDVWVDKFVLKEAEYQGREVPLNKPKRGGPKKFFVYVKNPKTGKIKKVNFGDSGNLSVKIKEPGARASFAARHNCDQKKDKTKPGYWSCNIGRYWKSLGGSRNFSGYW
jgi:hypothetical protein